MHTIIEILAPAQPLRREASCFITTYSDQPWVLMRQLAPLISGAICAQLQCDESAVLAQEYNRMEEHAVPGMRFVLRSDAYDAGAVDIAARAVMYAVSCILEGSILCAPAKLDGLATEVLHALADEHLATSGGGKLAARLDLASHDGTIVPLAGRLHLPRAPAPEQLRTVDIWARIAAIEAESSTAVVIADTRYKLRYDHARHFALLRDRLFDGHEYRMQLRQRCTPLHRLAWDLAALDTTQSRPANLYRRKKDDQAADPGVRQQQLEL